MNMRTYILVDNKKLEVEDRMVNFAEGDDIIIETVGLKPNRKVNAIRKVLIQTGDKLDVEQHIFLV